MRTPEDSAGVLEACATATDIAIVGTGFIGMEAAVTLVGKFPVSRLAKGRGLSCGRLRPLYHQPIGAVIKDSVGLVG